MMGNNYLEPVAWAIVASMVALFIGWLMQRAGIL